MGTVPYNADAGQGIDGHDYSKTKTVYCEALVTLQLFA